MNGAATQSQFELQKIKVLKGASGIEVDFNIRREDAGTQMTDRYSKETNTFPHPDLLKAIGSLKGILVKATGKESLYTDKVLDQIKGKQREEIEAHINDELEKVTVTGIAISGTDTNRGAIITGTYLCKNGAKIAINSPRIRFDGELFGFEGQLNEICQVIETETYLYTFQDKQAQASIVFEEAENER